MITCLYTQVARGEPRSGGERVALVWRAPDSCPPVASVRARVETLVGAPLSSPGLPEVRGVAEVREEGGAWSATIELTSGSGSRRRELQARRCQGIVEAFALLVAMTVDPMAGRPAPVEPAPSPGEAEEEVDELAALPEVDASAPPPVDSGTPARREPAPVSARRRSLRVALGASFVANVGALPELAPGLSVDVSALVRRLRLELHGVYFTPRARSFADVPEVGAELDLWWMAARGGWVFERGPIEFPVGGGVQLGSMRARGYGIVERGRRSILWVALAVGGGIRYAPAPWVALGLGLELYVPMTRPEFTVEKLGAVHRAAPLGGLFLVGLEFRAP